MGSTTASVTGDCRTWRCWPGRGWSSPSKATAARAGARRPAVSSGLDGGFWLRLGHDADVGLGRLPLTEDLARLVVGDRAGDDDVITLLPLSRGGDLVVGGQLQ